MGLCLEVASRRIAFAIGCEKFKSLAKRQHNNEAFVPGAFAPPGLHID
jgi:hypothetical protein